MKKLLLLLVLLGIPSTAFAQLGTVPHTFTTGVNDIDDLNENFSTAYSSALNRTGGTMTGTLTAQSIVPASTATYDFGSALTKFRDGFFSRNFDIGGNLNLVGTLSDSDSAVTVADQLALTSTSTPQVQFKYDGSNYLEFSVSSSGAVTINAAGASQGFAFSDPVALGLASITNITNSVIFTGTPRISNTGNHLVLLESDGSADSKIWRFDADGDSFRLRTSNDADNVMNNVFVVTRSGATVGNFTFLSPQTLVASGSISAPGLALSANTKAGLWSTSGGIVLSAQDSAGGAGDSAGIYVTASTSEGIVEIDSGNGTSGAGAILYVRGSRVEVSNGYLALAAFSFGTLPTPPSNGAILYCSDCTIASPCAGGGTGAIAKRLNGAWVCN